MHASGTCTYSSLRLSTLGDELAKALDAGADGPATELLTHLLHCRRITRRGPNLLTVVPMVERRPIGPFVGGW